MTIWEKRIVEHFPDKYCLYGTFDKNNRLTTGSVILVGSNDEVKSLHFGEFEDGFLVKGHYEKYENKLLMERHSGDFQNNKLIKGDREFGSFQGGYFINGYREVIYEAQLSGYPLINGSREHYCDGELTTKEVGSFQEFNLAKGVREEFHNRELLRRWEGKFEGYHLINGTYEEYLHGILRKKDRGEFRDAKFYNGEISYYDSVSKQEVPLQGEVKWFSAEKGEGFVVDSVNTNYFFSFPDVRGVALPIQGDRVHFKTAQVNGKLVARDIVIVYQAKFASEQYYTKTTEMVGNKIARPSSGKKIVHTKNKMSKFFYWFFLLLMFWSGYGILQQLVKKHIEPVTLAVTVGLFLLFRVCKNAFGDCCESNERAEKERSRRQSQMQLESIQRDQDREFQEQFDRNMHEQHHQQQQWHNH